MGNLLINPCSTYYAEAFADGISFHNRSTFVKSVLPHGGGNWGSEKTPSASLGRHEESHERQMTSNMDKLAVEYKKQNTSTDNNAHTF